LRPGTQGDFVASVLGIHNLSLPGQVQRCFVKEDCQYLMARFTENFLVKRLPAIDIVAVASVETSQTNFRLPTRFSASEPI
jgi:hypothetical protein